MVCLTKFFYDLIGKAKPTNLELDDEIDRLLYVRGPEEPDFLVPVDTRDQLNQLDSDVLSCWLNRRFQPVLLLMLLDSEDNYQEAKNELCKMESYKNIIDKFFRANFVHDRAIKRIKEIWFENHQIDLQKSIVGLRKTLVFISSHLEKSSPSTSTLLGTEAYTNADITLYNYLKRLVCGKYKDFGIKTHIRVCEPLKRFMARYAAKNRFVTDVSTSDPLTDTRPEPNLIADILRPGLVAVAILCTFTWRKCKN